MSAAAVTEVAWPRRIDLTHEDEAVRAITTAINDRIIPDTYVRSGQVTHVAEVDHGTGPQLLIHALDAAMLREQLSRHAQPYRVRIIKVEGKPVPREVPGLPTVATSSAVLSRTDWPGLQPLAGVTAVPIIRPDGTTLTCPGYDPATRLFHRPTLTVGAIPDQPTPDATGAARDFLFGEVLGDFPWDSDASRANYLALLMTPLLRLYMGGLPPFGLISATTRGSGKTLLTEIMRAAYGLRMTAWVRREEEMSKTITSLLKDTVEPVICFDNVDSFDTISHGVLAALLTSTEWSARLLGASSMATAVNDRLWLATGNNLTVGGDMASRSVLTRLDPRTERPEERTGFVIDDMWEWLKAPANRIRLLRALLVLARAWIAAGAPRAVVKLRNFSAWAQVMGGLTAFHGVEGFLANRDELEAADEEETSTAAFLLKWHEKFGAEPKRSTELVDSARMDNVHGTWVDPWDGTFPSVIKDGKSIPFTAKGLGRFLSARRDRIFAGLVLVGVWDSKSKVWAYKVLPHESTQSPHVDTESAK
ncbi:hypothetical protein [Spongiactinospora sp. TRM90649]|uniref:hypothetical protein n=1 Tax=Spongiactinospora sp. TRM90649 TaxID=3031114 RepID=UPI0023F9B412|nr:hypothetical protein [Spongiactinospora sp. TRM90649]MDF5755805.1 hypothetical protein [Spongiactinospora sp. TRM90649]